MKYILYTRFYFFLLSLLVISVQLQAKTISETFQKSLPFARGNLLTLSNENGDVEIKTWDKSEIEIIAHKRVKAKNDDQAEDMMAHLQIVINERDGSLDIKTDFPGGSNRDKGFFGWLFGKKNNEYSVEYIITIPKSADVNIATTNGSINVDDVTGRVRMESTNGEIRAENITGLVRCNTTNGSIKIDFDDIPEEDEMFFRTTNGSIRLYLPDDFGGDVDLKTTNGKIDCDFPMSGEKHKGRTSLRGHINSGDCEVTCSTTNGNIYLYASE